MTRTTIFEGKNAQRARVEAEIVERSERFRACPTLKIGSVTVINPMFEGPNPFENPELLDPENEGVLKDSVEADASSDTESETGARRLKKRRDRAKSEAYTKTPWLHETRDVKTKNRLSAPPLTTAPFETTYFGSQLDEYDPFRKDPVVRSSTAGNSFFLEEKRGRDYLQVEIPDNRLCLL